MKPARATRFAIALLVLGLVILLEVWLIDRPNPSPVGVVQRLALDGNLASDQQLGLDWQRCPVGMRLAQGQRGRICRGVPTRMGFGPASRRCAKRGPGWRVPSAAELSSIAGCDALDLATCADSGKLGKERERLCSEAARKTALAFWSAEPPRACVHPATRQMVAHCRVVSRHYRSDCPYFDASPSAVLPDASALLRCVRPRAIGAVRPAGDGP